MKLKLKHNQINNNGNISLGGLIYCILCIATAMIGYQIHGSVFWAIIDWWLAPLAWLKWMLCHEVNVSIIKEAFAFFLR